MNNFVGMIEMYYITLMMKANWYYESIKNIHILIAIHQTDYKRFQDNKMADFNLDRIRFRWRGEWDTVTSYIKDDVVLLIIDLYKQGK